jgi:hypothetical protein
MANRELIEKYVDILKTEANYTGKEIATLSEECGFKFSESTLVKSCRKKNETNEYYDVSVSTLNGITKVLEILLKYEENRKSTIATKLKEINVDLSNVPLINLTKEYPEEEHILIPWELSQQYEINAEEVYVITPTLNWARSQIDTYINSAIEKGDKYFFVLTEHRGLTNKVIIEKKVAEAGVSDKIQIKELYRLPEFSDYNGITVPVPYDIAIYINTYYPGDRDVKKTIAVTSIVVINPQTVDAKNEPNHQDIVINKQRTEELLFWAESAWGKLKNI